MVTVRAWMMKEPKKPLVMDTYEAAPGPGEALVAVAGCGVCHTDVSFLFMGVPTRKPPPLALGHEISGTVVAVGPGADASLAGKAVLVPAVLPCGECPLCKAGRRRICPTQVMPGNDRHGGFATHVVVPAKFLCPVPAAALATHELWELAVVADALTTPFQAVKRANVAPGDTTIFVGVGGIGLHGVQIAKAAGAKVVAIDVDAHRLEAARAAGADAAIDAKGLAFKDLKEKVKEAVKAAGGPKACWKIFETSGTKAGQETAFGLLGPGGTMAVVGFTLDKIEARLSNLMAFDAEMFGIWGCDPLLYPEALDWIAAGKIRVKPYVERHPLDAANEVLEAAHAGKLAKRAVLVP